MNRIQSINRYSGHYTLEVRRSDGSLRTKLEFDNLVTDNGLDLFVTSPTGPFNSRDGIFSYCVVGTGNTPPAFTDTQLANLLTSQAFPRNGVNNALFGTNTYVAGPTPYWRRVQTVRFGTGIAAGNLTEIGVGSAPTSLWSRAFITDSGGVPTTLTVLADEVLDVTFEVRNYIDTSETPFSFFINAVEYTGTYKAYDIDTVPSIEQALPVPGNPNTYNVPLFAYESNQVLDLNTPASGQFTQKGAISVDTYIAGSYQMDLTYRFELTEANFITGINSFIIIGTQNRHRFSFTPTLAKTNVQILTIGARLSWGRYP